MGRLLIIFGIWFLVDLYFFQAIKTITIAPIWRWTFWLTDALLLTAFLIVFFTGNFTAANSMKTISIFMSLMILSTVPKLLGSVILFSEDLYRLFHAVYTGIRQIAGFKQQGEPFIPERRKFVSQLALGIAAIPFAGIIYGIFKGKYEYTVHKIRLKSKDLPENFDGFTITQLSDIHSGSFTDKAAVERGIALANAQKSDLLVFTGDLVNNRAEEMDEWMESFSKLEAASGKYSILGNHDYGDYVQWNSETEKNKNLDRLKAIHGEIGFRLLLDEHLKIAKNGQEIALAGVQNWGMRGFHQYGNLNQALHGINPELFTVLLSHDPSHWEAQVLDHPKKVHLTLSGHTHGMQMGIEIPGFRWSPIQYIYKQWAGIYHRAEQHLYVNRGFGFLGFSGRVGILPEITVITLEKA